VSRWRRRSASVVAGVTLSADAVAEGVMVVVVVVEEEEEVDVRAESVMDCRQSEDARFLSLETGALSGSSDGEAVGDSAGPSIEMIGGGGVAGKFSTKVSKVSRISILPSVPGSDDSSSSLMPLSCCSATSSSGPSPHPPTPPASIVDVGARINGGGNP
jgi:hypothetical protein